jgi:type I restriction enzyme, S subunit
MRAMKDSGVEWLGEVPASWMVRPHWSVMREAKTPVGNLHTELDLLSLTRQGVIIRDLDGGGKFPANFESYQQVQIGDLILCLFDVEETPRTVGLAPAPGMITSAYTVMRISEVDPGFLEWYLIGMDNEKRFKPFYSGLRNTLSKDVFGSIRFAMPPLDEQKAIVSYLNQETSQVEVLISKKEQLIERLLERRKALITHVVTKGLNPDAPMKDSGVEWLGQVPESWSTHRARHLLTIESRPFDAQNPLLSVYLNRGVILHADGSGSVHAPSEDLSGYQTVAIGDLVMNNQQAWRGSVGISELVGNISPAYVVCSFKVQINRKFANFLFRSAPLVGQLETSSRGVGDIQRQLNLPAFKNIVISLPSISEQRILADYLDSETSHIDILVEKAKRAIELLKERRQALITQVVTGKIDVRGFAGGNP